MPASRTHFVPLLVVGIAMCLGAPSDANPIRAVGVYVWDRATDVCDILQCGVAVGPSLGAEAALTEHLQIGAYAAQEGGVTFPHFLPPLWPLTELDGKPVFRTHAGPYATTALGTRRWQNHLGRAVRFPRSRWDVRVQLAAGIAHVYVRLNLLEVGDFMAGIAGVDLMRDDGLPQDR